MGPNSKRAQAASAASRNTPSRARFSKPPPSKKKGGRGGRGRGGGRGGNDNGGRGEGRGRGGGRGRGRGGGRGNNRNSKPPSNATRANVIDKLSKRVHDKAKKRSEGTSKKAKASNHPLAGLDKSKLDEVVLSDELIQIVSKLLTDLNVMESTPNSSYHGEMKYGDSNEMSVDGDDESIDSTDVEGDKSPLIKDTPLFIHLMTQLSFSEDNAQRACAWSNLNNDQEVKANGNGNETSLADEMGLAMDWLCLHLSEDELKQGFKLNKNRNMKKSSSKTALSIQSVNTGAVRSIAHPSISVPLDKNWRESMSQQTRMLGFVRLGFHQSESIRACSEIKDVEVTHNPLEDVAAIKLLLSMLEKEFLGEYVTTHDSLSAADLTYVESERKQEEEALQAIFEDKFKIRSEDCKQGLGQWYILSIEPNDDLQQPARAEESKLIVLIRPGYPVFCPPLLLFTNPTLPPSLLRRINIAIIEEAHQNVGEPIVFSIVHFLSENLCDMQREFSEELRAKETKSEIVGLLDHPRGTTNGSVEAQEEKAHSGENLDSSKLDFMETLRRKIANVTIDGDRTDKKLNMKVESSNRSPTSHVPKPVAVPTGDLGVIMKDIAKVQTAQPWLVSPDARVPVRDTKSSDLTSTQRREQSKISNKLRNDLERWNQAAEQWSEKGGKFGKNECKMLSQRKRLPAYKVKEKIVKTIASNQITVISGDTGSGKTTQVPQLVLDDMISNNKGSEANIIVTQPRRISAIGVSERIASERCERVGETVGYSIRLENKRSSKTRLLLCTTGILLRRLQCDPDLASVSHVFVDEVHERDLNTDFLLIILKDLLLRRKNLKLVLMSATLNADTFSSYFGGSPTVSIPGRTHPVEENRLEDVLALTGYEVKEGSDYALKKNSKKTRLTKSDLKKLYPNYDAKVHSSLAIADESVINYELIACLLEHIALHQEDGAILVFLPGMMEITKTIEELQKLEFFQDQSKTVIYPLHSSLSTAEQTAVFQVPQEGIRKIVVATNIAETSITIEDVVYVVDAGRVKENRQDEVNQMMTLVDCWVSRASAKQRRGRAGRVRPGISYHLYSTHTNRNDMQEYQLPEMLRVGLEDLVLQILLLDLGEPSIFLTKAVNPPSALAIRNSLKLLEGLGAVDCDWDENEVIQKDTKLGSNESSCQILSVNSGLTALGFHLATLPVDPRVGKMMIYGALFGCIDPALTIAASMSARNPFMSPFDKRAEADAARKNFAIEGSDHLTTLNAFNQWKQMRTKKGDRAAQSFLRDSFLSRMTLFQMEDLRKQFAKLLVDIGFLPKGFRLPNSLGRGQESTSTAVQNATNANCNNMHLVKAVLCAGLYPNIIVAPKNDKKGGGGMSAFESLKGDVYLHPSTISFSEKKLESRYCCYHEIVKTTKSFVRDATPVSEFALLLFGGNLKVYHTHGVVTLDDWLKFRISAKPATLVKHLRAQMEKMLLRKIITPEDDVIGSSEGKSLIQAVSTLFEREIKEVPNAALEDNEGRRESNNDRIPERREHHSSSSYTGKEQNTRGGNRHYSGHSARGGGRGRKNDSYGGRSGGRGRGRGGRR